MYDDEVEMKSGSAIQSAPAAYDGGDEYRQGQKLERYLNFFSSLAFSATLVASWETTGAGLQAGLFNGGPAVIVYGLIISAIGNLAIACSLAELATVHPTAGAQYHWTYILAPGYRRFFSFFQGWVFSWAALVCIAPFIIGNQIAGMVVLSHPEYDQQRWHGTLLMWAVLLIPIIINVFARRLLPLVEVAAGIMHCVFLPVTIAVFLILAPRNPDAFVWDNFISGLSGWKDPGVVFSVGLLGVIAPFTGVDGVIHMAEEVKNAKTAIPRSMIWGTLINAVMAFSYAITVLYCMGNYEEALTSVTGYPVIQIAYQASGNNLAATYVLMALGILPGWVALFNSLASVTRLTWAFARDNGLPFSNFFVKVDPRLKIPVRALFLVAACVVVLSFIQIGSTAAFNAILSLSTEGIFISYLIPLVFLVFKRFTAPGDIPQGEFSLGKWGLPINIVAILFATYFAIFLPFPPEVPVTAEGMNYAGPVLGFVMVFACVDWLVRGRHKWNGPTMNFCRE
ncbi:amino acid transporter [Aspergillus pseudonomiae]|uniref:Amino acid transporter n=1 Tax=Aspergillus pseudonomiae TaxID=1506151 RepID=A0A5N7D6M2_9EURO|nr:amino acid transporter [Aspergillus pseudonomiae]KAE8402004.1 amino acid transporter [Aspergillus pseudonomiae]